MNLKMIEFGTLAIWKNKNKTSLKNVYHVSTSKPLLLLHTNLFGPSRYATLMVRLLHGNKNGVEWEWEWAGIGMRFQCLLGKNKWE